MLYRQPKRKIRIPHALAAVCAVLLGVTAAVEPGYGPFGVDLLTAGNPEQRAAAVFGTGEPSTADASATEGSPSPAFRISLMFFRHR